MPTTFLTDTSPDHNFFYVSAIDGPRHFLMAGPYDDHDTAKNMVDKVRDYAADKDGRAWFMAWGTAGSTISKETRLGPLTSIPGT